jgi:hypothetical protein
MGTPTTWRDCRLTSPAVDRTELMVGRLRTASERSKSTASGHRALAGSLRLAGGVIGVPPLVGSLTTPPSNQFVRLRLSSDDRHAMSLDVSWRSVFELRDCRPYGRWRARRTTLSRFSPFVLLWDIRRPVTHRHRW